MFTIDVEDWFHIPELPSAGTIATWDNFESRVDRNFRTLLDVLDHAGVKATCFVLGWVAERWPNLVREAATRGHEIASHGYSHTIVTAQTREQFAADIRKAKEILETAAGTKVLGYRAPAFSITKATPWALGELVRAGFEYDASLFPAKRDYGGMAGPKAPHVIDTEFGPIAELPMSIANLGGKDLCFFGGGYLRLFPHFLIRRMARQVNAEGRPVIYYLHPREVDPHQPRLPMPPLKRFKVYVNLKSVGPKLDAILHEESLVTCRSWLESNRSTLTTRAA